MQVSMNIDGIIFSMAIESSPFREMIDDRENERFLFSASVTDVQGSEEEITVWLQNEHIKTLKGFIDNVVSMCG